MRNQQSAALRERGEVVLDDCGLVLSRAMQPRDIERLAAGAVERLHHRANESRITLHPQSIAGVRFHVTLRFSDDRLSMIELMASSDDVPELRESGAGGGEGGRAWTRENEVTRKRFHEQWAADALGVELAIKPWVDPDLPQPVMPANPGPAHPRAATFEWGEIGSYLDEKGGAAMLIVTLTAR